MAKRLASTAIAPLCCLQTQPCGASVRATQAPRAQLDAPEVSCDDHNDLADALTLNASEDWLACRASYTSRHVVIAHRKASPPLRQIRDKASCSMALEAVKHTGLRDCYHWCCPRPRQCFQLKRCRSWQRSGGSRKVSKGMKRRVTPVALPTLAFPRTTRNRESMRKSGQASSSGLIMMRRIMWDDTTIILLCILVLQSKGSVIHSLTGLPIIAIAMVMPHALPRPAVMSRLWMRLHNPVQVQCRKTSTARQSFLAQSTRICSI